MRLAGAALALLLLAPIAAAHVEDYSQSRALQAGPYLVFFEPRPTPPFAANTVSLVAQVSDSATGGLVTDVPATAIVAGEGGFSERKRMEPDGTGYLIASMVLPHAGNYSARILLTDPDTNETHGADTEFEVFPDLPFRIRPVDAALDVYTGQRIPLAFETIDPVTLGRKDAFDDLTIRMEHWSDDHSQFLGAEEMQAQEATPGIWRIDYIFPESGMYHVRFASQGGGFNYADVPLLHIYALSPRQAGIDGEDDGGANVPAAPLALLVAALALVSLLRKR